ncbi:MAG: DNA gyrase subunit A [Oscillospiraceae bacterium]|nr:DNA gyrase subunit A [Oscillospiraceae bacterium]
MAKNRDYKPEDILFPNQAIISNDLVKEMETSFMEYSMSVIVDRALPDVRDGLKPVHRRILYALYEDGLTSDKPFRKSATCVGDVIGRYHPHGDASVYDAMVRLAQDFSMRCRLIEGHGNFGSIDGDPPAAYRYTEARMSKLANEMLRDIEKQVIDWVPNFDETRKEPKVLPSRFPNLLVNGSSGIAVGMATNIPPHNLREVIDACLCVLENPEAELSDLMQYIKGPDFPTKGIIMGRSGIRAAYATGRGRILVRGRTEFEEHGQNRIRIIVTELPYQVNKKKLVENIAEQVKDKRLEGISDLRDESDRNGMRIVIELKKDANPQVVLNRLFAQTALQSSFSVNMLALVDDQSQPRCLTLRNVLDEYLSFQEQVIIRRTQYDLKKAEERAHILEGLLIAQDNIDEVIRIIRSAYDDAKERLMERFGLSEIQAQTILDMRLKALQGLEREKLEAEYQEIEKKISYFKAVLADMNLVKGILKDELTAIRDQYGDERLTEIQDVEDELDIEDLIEEEDCVFTISEQGYMKRMPVTEYRAQRRGGRGIHAANLKEEDFVKDIFAASTHDSILFFTDRGRCHRKKGYQIPEASRTARGTAMINVLPLEPGESVTAGVNLREFAENEYLIMVTRKGTVKRIQLSELNTARKAGIKAITLEEDDNLISVRRTDGDQKILLATRNGMAICFHESDVRCMGRGAAGVRGITLAPDDYLVGANIYQEGKTLLSVTENGYGKRTELSAFLKPDENGARTQPQSRGGKGMTAYGLSEKTGKVAGVRIVSEDEDLMVIENNGVIIRMQISDINVYGRTAQGVRVMRLEEGSKVISVETVSREVEEEEEPRQSEQSSGETPAEQK